MNYDGVPAYEARVNAASDAGPLETWRLCMGIGGINAQPAEEALGERAARAADALNLPMIRIFLQEYLNVVRPDGSYDWSRADAYIHSAARFGKVMAAFCMKPPALFGRKDPRVILPEDAAAWDRLVRETARRYAGVITHWEAGNETDIGESGGCPLLIEDDDAYNAYYRRMAAALREGSPEAKVGGSALANAASSTQLASLIAYCRAGNAPLDFISWHVYASNPERHAALVRKYDALLADWPGERPLMTVTEWAADFPSETGSVAETAEDPRRTASYFAAARAYLDAKLDYSFFYHLYDCTFFHADFEPFFVQTAGMNKHWNEVPHRFGMFGHDGRARPHYQLWRMLRGLGARRLDAAAAHPDLVTLAGAGDGGAALMVGNFHLKEARPLIADVWFDGLEPGVYDAVVERVCGGENLSRDGLTLEPIDARPVSTSGSCRFPVYLPPYAVARVSLARR